MKAEARIVSSPLAPGTFAVQSPSFVCPHCLAFAQQNWQAFYAPGTHGVSPEDIWRATCQACHRISIWYGGKLVYPPASTAPLANPDMPADAMDSYNEARAILALSPRGAAALLRLAIQQLCIELGLPGKNINKDIGTLVEQGLSPRLQRALDVVRVVGNEAVHPGTIDLNDTPEVASSIFGLVNLIVEQMISNDKHIDAEYAKLPQGVLDKIVERDTPKPPKV